eukprot:CAMPEP_0174252150 /NCGR_PEP_ID=MMETSP0439-20130205/1746_1 /TAXON_ID=0 /ORGANISM="Stereomyxa ramosa, Strain Chinc5" /LENGTH=462 /DNA_ID=CAMNT_0015332647 /DNA_START=113 /DNA_END=1498 /DNA_ORIENTATION=+
MYSTDLNVKKFEETEHSPLPPTPDGVMTITETGEQALRPKQIVEELDKFIIGQADAKKAVAIALRNRWRRLQLPDEMIKEIIPKNILMIGPTGVGKTEVARRLSKLAQAPFIKVEATKFTEVGFHGRDVDQIIRDLVEVAINEATQRTREKENDRVKLIVEEKLLELLSGPAIESCGGREQVRNMLRKGDLDDRLVDYEVPARRNSFPGKMPLGNEVVESFIVQMSEMKPKVKKRMKISECRPYVTEHELENVMNKEAITRAAISAVENNGIVFIDEIDKICSTDRYGADASSEGVQRDLLPLIEGTTISTKHGNIDTSKILFIASGAFHSCKPSDLLAELQGRLPIRVQLSPLTRNDLYKILTETKYNQIEQAVALLATEGLQLEFTDAAIQEIAKLTYEVNETVQNIGARRLHTVLEKILEDISFECPVGKKVVDVDHVRSCLSEMLKSTDPPDMFFDFS